jgi:dTDP-D-glucose 4,6-dehydratase
VELIVEETNDHRSYHVSSEKISKKLGFRPKFSIEQAVEDLVKAFEEGKLPDSMNDIRYFNIKTMKAVHLQ